MDHSPVDIVVIADAADGAGLKEWFRTQPGYRVAAVIGRRESVLKKVRAVRPGIVIISAALPGFAWSAIVNELKLDDPVPAVVVISEVAGEADLLSAFRQGVDAFISKEAFRERLPAALKAVTTGGIYYQRRDTVLIREHLHDLEMGSARRVHTVRNSLSRLTVREKEVFPLLADGKSIKEVARILRISPKTVESHKYNIMKKLDFENMTDWTKTAIMKEIIPL